MIPKKIHYCWLSDDPIPADLCQYIEGWKKVLPDYEFKKWDKSAFDIHSSQWVEDAYNMKKWAFAADYIRAYALYTEGGFYLDSDVLLYKSLDPFLNYGFVSSFEVIVPKMTLMKKMVDENGNRIVESNDQFPIGIQAAIIGAEKGNSFLSKLLDYYNTNSFKLPNGNLNIKPAPLVYAQLLESYGMKYMDKQQNLKDRVTILDSSVFAGYMTAKFSSVAVHMCAGSWLGKVDNSFWGKVKKNLFLRKVVNTFRKW